jgi:D-alanyl-D-alanine carboxypeptidase/D-alanyl-D-alanine-endopeptidase (penicillin-binding protein 4)
VGWLVLALLLSGCALVPPGGQSAETPSATPPASASATATPEPEPEPPPPLPDGPTLKKLLQKVGRTALKDYGYAVYGYDGVLLAAKGDEPMVPASTTKVITALAALDVLGPQHTFATRVLSDGSGAITLVGGGDPGLMSAPSEVKAQAANLDTLAALTVAALQAAGTASVTLQYDESLFCGELYAKSWKSKWSGYTSRVSALTVNNGKSTVDSTGARALSLGKADTDPAKAAAKVFAQKLKAAGVKVKQVRAGQADDGAAEIARVTSAPLGTIVRRMLRYSENFTAEVLARQVAIAQGKGCNFAKASAALTSWMKAKGLWQDGDKIDGGSGLSSKARLSPSTLAKAVLLALGDAKYADALDGFPVAGKSGTLSKKAGRFNDKAEKAGIGVVHAKTGSLTGIATLAGYVEDADGAILVFAFMSAHAGQTSAFNWIDRSATVLATCGCR